MKVLPVFFIVAGLTTICLVLLGFVQDVDRSNANAGGRKSSLAPMQPSSAEQWVLSSAPSQVGSAMTCFTPEINQTVRGVISGRVCFDSSSCTGTVRLTVTQCNKNSPSTISNDPLLNFQLRKWGPDLFRMRLEGPEIISNLSAYSGECSYFFPISISREGTYNLAVEWLYRDYDAVNEAFSLWPNLLKQPVFLTNASESKYHFQQRTLESMVNLDCSISRETPSQTAPCVGDEADLSGKWVRQGHDSMHTRVRVRKIRRSPIVFEWAIQKEPFATWHPFSCHRPEEIPVGEDLAALRGRRVVVAGDSQLRALYFGLVNVMNSYGKDCVQNLTSVDREPPYCILNAKGSHRNNFGGVQIDFYDDPFLDKFSGGKFDSYDVFIIGFAQHPASKEHWPFRRYQSSVMKRVQKIKHLRSHGKHFVWYLSPQFPHTTNGYPVVVRDWRTDSRLTEFNKFAEMQMREQNVLLLDGFAISSPMSHTSSDQAHYSNFVSYEIVNMLRSSLRFVARQLQ